MVFSYNWQLPALAGSAALVTQRRLGNWEMSGILTLQSGDAFTVLAGKDQSQTGLNEDRAIARPVRRRGAGGCGQTAPCVDYLNPDSFALPAIGTFGNIGRNAIRGPGLVNWDMSFLQELFRFASGFRFQLRAEMFNAVNA